MRIESTATFLKPEQPGADLDTNHPERSSGTDLGQEAAAPSISSIAERANDQFEKAIYSIAMRTELGASTAAAPGSTTLATHTDDNSLATPATASSTRRGAPATTSGYQGMQLGINEAHQPVTVKREVGSEQGYDDRLQATAIARMYKAEPAVVVQSEDGKWHALETTAGFAAGPVSGTGKSASGGSHTPTPVALYGLPSSAGLAAARQNVQSIRTQLHEIEQRRANGDNSQALYDQASEFARQLNQATVTLASLALGVPESEVNLIRSSADRKPGKVNIHADQGQPAGLHGTGTDSGFDPDATTSFEIKTTMLDSEAGAGTLFHEVTHLNDYKLAQHWVKTYEQETKRPFIGSAQEPFQTWLDSQSPKRLSKTDAELVKDQTVSSSATTEARANVGTFLRLLQSGNAEAATKDISAYARELKPGGAYGTPANGSQVQAGLTQELKTAYQQMPKGMRQQFDAAMASARKTNPDAWVSKIDFKK